MAGHPISGLFAFGSALVLLPPLMLWFGRQMLPYQKQLMVVGLASMAAAVIDAYVAPHGLADTALAAVAFCSLVAAYLIGANWRIERSNRGIEFVAEWRQRSRYVKYATLLMTASFAAAGGFVALHI